MKAVDYDYISGFLMQSSGLSLGTGKEYLLEARLMPLAQSWGLTDVESLVGELRRGRDSRLSQAVTEAMTTNETLFFRDKTPFDDLKNTLLPKLIEARSTERRLRIWCAASSTGQEPYSLAMLLRDHFPILANWTLDISASDISQAMLDRAQEGIYSQFEVQRGLPVQLLVRHFEQTPKGWQVKEPLRKLISWKKINLLDNFFHLGPLDLVMCRNVLIYFDPATKKSILDRISRITRPDGYLMLGAAETVLGITESFQRFRGCTSAVYTPVVS